MSEAVLDTHSVEPNTGVSNAKLGMWLFLASEVMFFTGLIGAYIVLRLGADAWPDPNEILATGILATNTFILIVSSVTMVMALHAVQHNDRGKLILFLVLTALLGLSFLCIKAYDYNHMWHEGTTLSSSLFGSCYYTLTGFHGLHVLAGVISIACLAIGAARGSWNSEQYDAIENIGLYWHFVDLVWIILFAILCLI